MRFLAPFLGLALAALLAAAPADTQPRLTPADELMRTGADAFRRGDFATAGRDWKQADVLYAAAKNVDGRLDAWLNLAAVEQQVGNFKAAKETLKNADDLASANNRADKLVGIRNARGVAETFTRGPLQAELYLTEAAELAASQNAGPGALAGIKNNLGNLYASWAEVLSDQDKTAKYAAAFDNYTASADLARQAGDASLAAKATTNAALSAARGGQADKARDLAGKAIQSLHDLPDSAERANLLIAVGQAIDLVIKSKSPGIDEPRLQRQAFDAYEQAGQVAKSINNSLAGSYAAGYQGRLYEVAQRWDEALTLTRRAVLLAEASQSGDSLFLWKWQTGRILKGQGKPDEAITAYLGARDTLQAVRSDQALGYGNRGMGWTFRKEVGPLYYELADLLLARADTAGSDEARVQQYLTEARDTVERLRVGEFESYFEDPCRNQAAARQTDLTKDLGKLPSGNPAVIYLIPLSDRIEILVTTKQGMRRIKSPGVSSEQLTQQIREFRQRLERRGTHRYLANAKQLYTWLIKPIEPILESEKVDTLVFVPDGALRTIPMSALHDGTDFLIAKYAVAVSPGLSLSVGGNNPNEVSKSARRVLASGLSEAQTGFDELPNVVDELGNIGKIYGGATTLLNAQFSTPSFEQELSRPVDEEYSIVHIASHGVFAADVAKTFILTYGGGKLTLDDLQSVLQPYQLRNKPIDLLTLSACQTSAGDDQAANERASLGLGGLAVKAGARSAMASLWLVNDQATGQLITAFYEELALHPEAGKAKALQQAQLKLIHGGDFAHPVYWAPFLMIGDWL